MTNEAGSTQAADHTHAPADPQSPTRHPALQALDAFVGEWALVSPQYPDVREQVVFTWLEGGAFLVQHADAKHSQFPTSTTIVGLDDSNAQYSMLYYDSRGVSRVYQMSLLHGVWKLWRDAPGFSQRFMGTFSEDGTTITATWEKSWDGVAWEHDFDLIYTKGS